MQLSKCLPLLALTVALGSFVGCEQRPDPTEHVSKALKDANFDAVKVDWDKQANVAHLKGTVDRATDRQRAEEIAASAVGTSGTVLNEINVQEAPDHTLADLDGEIKNTLMRIVDNDQALRGRDIAFAVTDGIVVVKGEVRSIDEKKKVSDLVRSVPGVKDVTNSLDVTFGRR